MKQYSNIILSTVGFLGCLFAHAVDEHAGYAVIAQELLQKYKRSITVLTVGDDTHYYTCKIAQQYDATCVSILTRHADLLRERIMHNQLDNVVILNPPHVAVHDLVKLGSCEHFDCVLVRDLTHIGDGTVMQTIQHLLCLGDFVVIHMSQLLFDKLPEKLRQGSRVLLSEQGDLLVLFEPKCKTLELPRWNSRGRKPNVIYEIRSSFYEKKLYKEPACSISDWLRGINLITFTMLHGVYPTNDMIYTQLQSFKKLAHNDLVIGNIIVQGARIRPIDFNDARRNIDPSVCVKGALGVFNSMKRLKDPSRALEKYSDYIQKHKRAIRF